jgi:hypothetical protein
MDITDDLKDQLKTVRDEIRVQLHLAGMEAREAWTELEAEYQDIHAAADRVPRAVLHNILDKLKTFAASLAQ